MKRWTVSIWIYDTWDGLPKRACYLNVVEAMSAKGAIDVAWADWRERQDAMGPDEAVSIEVRPNK